MSDEELRERAVAEFKRRKEDGFMFPNAQNAFVQGYMARFDDERADPAEAWPEYDR